MDLRGAAAAQAQHALPRPLHCEWAWRAGPWSESLALAPGDALADGSLLAPGVTLHHDDPAARVEAAQQATPDGPAPFALRLGADRFAGSFLSLAVDLPPAAAPLLARHLLGVHLALAQPLPTPLYLRLNILHGPNTAQMLRAVDPRQQGPEPVPVEFDLAYARFNPRRVTKIWCDVILTGAAPGPVAVPLSAVLLDLAFTRRPRAEM
jgi:hypothetical protein